MNTDCQQCIASFNAVRRAVWHDGFRCGVALAAALVLAVLAGRWVLNWTLNWG